MRREKGEESNYKITHRNKIKHFIIAGIGGGKGGVCQWKNGAWNRTSPIGIKHNTKSIYTYNNSGKQNVGSKNGEKCDRLIKLILR